MEKDDVGPNVYALLRFWGYSDRRIARFSRQTRLYHDLKIDGDTAQECMEEFAARHNVDMSDFVFDAYFPPEFWGGNFLTRLAFTMIPGVRWAYDKKRGFKPLTLGMLEDAIDRGKWQAK